MRIVRFQNRMVEAFQKEVWSAYTLLTGGSGFTFFKGTEAATLRNYSNGGNNFFESNQGVMIGLRAELYAASFAAFNPFAGAAAYDALDAYEALRAQGMYEIQINSKPHTKGRLANILPKMPSVYRPLVAGVPANTYGAVAVANNADGGGDVNNAQKYGNWFRPPIEIPNGQTVNVVLSFPSGYTIDADLNNHILLFELNTFDVPQAAGQPTLAAS